MGIIDKVKNILKPKPSPTPAPSSQPQSRAPLPQGKSNANPFSPNNQPKSTQSTPSKSAQVGTPSGGYSTTSSSSGGSNSNRSNGSQIQSTQSVATSSQTQLPILSGQQSRNAQNLMSSADPFQRYRQQAQQSKALLLENVRRQEEYNVVSQVQPRKTSQILREIAQSDRPVVTAARTVRSFLPKRKDSEFIKQLQARQREEIRRGKVIYDEPYSPTSFRDRGTSLFHLEPYTETELKNLDKAGEEEYIRRVEQDNQITINKLAEYEANRVNKELESTANQLQDQINRGEITPEQANLELQRLNSEADIKYQATLKEVSNILEAQSQRDVQKFMISASPDKRVTNFVAEKTGLTPSNVAGFISGRTLAQQGGQLLFNIAPESEKGRAKEIQQFITLPYETSYRVSKFGLERPVTVGSLVAGGFAGSYLLGGLGTAGRVGGIASDVITIGGVTSAVKETGKLAKRTYGSLSTGNIQELKGSAEEAALLIGGGLVSAKGFKAGIGKGKYKGTTDYLFGQRKVKGSEGFLTPEGKFTREKYAKVDVLLRQREEPIKFQDQSYPAVDITATAKTYPRTYKTQSRAGKLFDDYTGSGFGEARTVTSKGRTFDISGVALSQPEGKLTLITPLEVQRQGSRFSSIKQTVSKEGKSLAEIQSINKNQEFLFKRLQKGQEPRVLSQSEQESFIFNKALTQDKFRKYPAQTQDSFIQITPKLLKVKERGRDFALGFERGLPKGGRTKASVGLFQQREVKPAQIVLEAGGQQRVIPIPEGATFIRGVAKEVRSSRSSPRGAVVDVKGYFFPSKGKAPAPKESQGLSIIKDSRPPQAPKPQGLRVESVEGNPIAPRLSQVETKPISQPTNIPSTSNLISQTSNAGISPKAIADISGSIGGLVPRPRATAVRQAPRSRYGFVSLTQTESPSVQTGLGFSISQRQQSQQSFMQSQTQTTNQVQVQNLGLGLISNQVQNQNQKQNQRKGLLGNQVQNLGQNVGIVQEQNFLSGLIQGRESGQRQLQRQSLKLKQVSFRQGFNFRSREGIPTIKPRPIIVPTSDEEEETPKKERGYLGFVKLGGQKVIVTGKPVTRTQALQSALSIADVGLGRTAGIIATKKTVKRQRLVSVENLYKFRTFQQKQGRRTPLESTFIEKSKYALEAQEQRQIRPLATVAIRQRTIQRKGRQRLF